MHGEHELKILGYLLGIPCAIWTIALATWLIR
jgi:hypothetical protein